VISAADHAGAVDRNRARRLAQAQHGVAVDHPRMVEVDVVGAIRPRSGRDHEMIRGELLVRAVAGDHLDLVRARERRLAVDHLDLVALVEAAPHAHLAGDHLAGVVQQLRVGDLGRLGDMLE
jgi:hypothetical protein